MKNLIIIAGPTAVGKSDFAVELAKKIDGEIISADSVQVYKGLNIGSAKITQTEMQGIKHYLIDVLEPTEEFNVVLFQRLAKEAIKEVLAKGKTPILVGGTGFYIQAVLYDIDFSESEGETSSYREELENLAKDKGPDFLFEMLKEKDPKSAEVIHKNNVKRVIRALEFIHETGKPISEHNQEQRKKEPAYNACYFVLNDEREAIYDRINRRVDRMINEGLVDEVSALKEMGLDESYTSMQGIGYKEILMYLNGQISLDEAIYKVKIESRHFAKRQLTWFNREPDIIWLNRQNYKGVDELLNTAVASLKTKGIM